MDIVNIGEKFKLFQEQWSPKIVGELNGQYVKLAKLQGEFVWHSHEEEDELFMVFQGKLTMHFREKTVVVNPGEFLIVPKGVEHLPVVEGEEVHLLLFEPKQTLHTGEVHHAKTDNDQQWL
ncbi:MAG: cupin domain-containing protein [Bacteroidota bacterium]